MSGRLRPIKGKSKIQKERSIIGLLPLIGRIMRMQSPPRVSSHFVRLALGYVRYPFQGIYSSIASCLGFLPTTPAHPASPINCSMILTCVRVSKRLVGVYPAFLSARRRPLVTSNSWRKRRVAVRYFLSG